MSTTVEITEATLKGGYSLDYKYSFKDSKGFNHTVGDTCDAPVHDDLTEAFEKLIPHLALIIEDITKEEAQLIIENGFPKEEPKEGETSIKRKYNVTSFKLSGNGDAEGVSIIGTKLLKIGKDVKITTPKLRWDEKDYPFISELSEAIEDLKIEVNEYLSGKVAPDNQLDMFKGFGDDNEENVEHQEDTAA